MENSSQINLLDEITIDGFCGGGGWSTGFGYAIGEPVTIGINHDADAIAMHKKNHPYTKHYNENIFEVDPRQACAGRPVGWAHFSPDCTHFSRAKGGKPVTKKIRGLAWVIVKWAGTVHPRIISMENVKEFMTWGPLVAQRDKETGRVIKIEHVQIKDEITGKTEETVQYVVAASGEVVPYNRQLLVPDKKRSGRTFRAFCRAMKKLGYEYEFKILKACDYGAPTSRERLFGMFRRDGKPICWPEPTHGDPHSEEVKCGKLQPWRTASEIIDWSLPCPSIFERKRPLAENTLRRIARGIQKFVVEEPEPFIVNVNHSGDNFRGQSVNNPLQTVTSHHGYGLVMPYLTQYHSYDDSSRGQTLKDPLLTVDTNNRYALTVAFLTKFYGTSIGSDMRTPLPTVTGNGQHIGEVRAFLVKFYGKGTGQKITDPLGTITSKDRFGLITIHGEAYLIVDIGMRMLTPRELYSANGFPLDYEIEFDCNGKSYPKSKQVARCGNSVPPQFAFAIALANWTDKCRKSRKKINTMQEFNNLIAV